MLRNILINKIVLPMGDLIFKGNFINKLKHWKEFTKFSEKELKNFQEKKLKEQLFYTSKYVPKYKDIIIDKDEDVVKSLKKFPILSKDDLRNNPNELKIQSHDKEIKVYSSGSTGVSTWVAMNMLDLTSLQSLSFAIWQFCGYKFGDKVLQTGISPNRTMLKKLKDVFFGTYYVSAFTLSNNDLDKICNKLSSKKKHTVIGYPSSLNIIALHALKNNCKLNIVRAIGLGDALLPHYRKNIEKAFDCKIHETYGSSEGFQIGFQVDLDYMYLFSPQVYLEILDDDNNPVKEGEIGHVVVTRLDNKYMPLIRYKLGDLAIMLPRDKYPKNRKYHFPLIEKVIGRNTDIVVLPDSRKLIVHSFTGVFEYIDEIKQFKIIQKDNEGIIIQYIPDEKFTIEVLKKVKEKLQEFILDKNFKILFEEVAIIKSSKSGKPQIIESFLK